VNYIVHFSRQKGLIFFENGCIIVVTKEVCDVSDSCTEVLM